jgi:hypothetical protein
MGRVCFLEKISMDPPREKIYQRLGYRKHITELSTKDKKETDRLIQEASSLISIKGAFLRLSVHRNDGETIFLTEGPTFVSRKLAAFLRHCPEVILMAATAGQDIMDAIRTKTTQDNLAAAVVYDATASEMVDAGLDWIMHYVNQQLRREGKTLLPRRFSAGYADFHLQHQKAIHEALQMSCLGIGITPEFILIPEKSVTAISGIRS